MTQALPTAEEKTRGPNRRQRRQAVREARRRSKAASGAEKTAALLRAAAVRHDRGELPAAEKLYRQVLSEAPAEHKALFRLGSLLAQTDRADASIEMLERARSLVPDYAPTHSNLAVMYAAKGWADKAAQSFEAAYRHAGSDAETIKNYAAWCYRQGRLAEAAEALSRGLALAPEDAKRQSLLGIVSHGLGREEEALACFEQALALSPDVPEYNANYGSLLWTFGRLSEAVPYLAKGFPHNGHDPAYQTIFAKSVKENPLDEDMPGLEEAFIACFDAEQVELDKMTVAVGRYIGLKYARHARPAAAGDSDGTGARNKLHLDGILGDPILIRLLQKAINTNVGLETILLPLRRALLFKAPEQPSLSREIIRFMASFAMQCHNNSYVFFESEPEKQAVEKLHGEVERRLASDAAPERDLEMELALLAMYRPLHSLAGFERLLAVSQGAWSAELEPLIERSLLEPAREEEIKATIPAFGSIEDETSQAVRSQYEENPYPRWVTMPLQEVGSLAQALRKLYPWTDFPEDSAGGQRCLVAGCGTGRQPIGFARRFPHFQVVAADLSLASLAYAKRMAQRYGVTNITFHHGDLLEIAELGRDFDVIECSGVLHHMRAPEEGLAALLDVLRPGGLIRLGFYSALAREWVNVARERIAELGLEHTAEDIRAFRLRVLNNQEPGLLTYTRMTDFYDLDSFRDMIFHFVEHQFTVPEIGRLCARFDLDFLGFSNLKDHHREAYAQRFPKDLERRDLESWDAFEHDHRDLFLGMYDFWCRKPA